MKMRIVQERDDFIELLIQEEDASIIDSLSEYINRIDGVEYAGYRIEHPLTGDITLTVKTRGKPTARRAVLDALKNLRDFVASIQEEVQKL
ncbi:MAG: DNA-directed RNA polymerase subunit L [Aigarchaeota archaeon]|nr:DNA-directed RNA polymerase subunit L [Candidatus Pelearchaeum maunauluense]